MTDWITIRGTIATLLTGVSITSPISTSLVRVYEQPPRMTAEYPSVIIAGCEKAVTRQSQLRTKRYTAHMQLLAYDAESEQALAICDALEEVIISTFDSHLTLGIQGVQLVDGPDFKMAGRVEYGGNQFVGADFTLPLLIVDGVAFAA